MELDEYFMGQSKAGNQTASSWSAVKVEDPATTLRHRVISLSAVFTPWHK